MTIEVEGQRGITIEEVAERIGALFASLREHRPSFGEGGSRILLRVNHPLPKQNAAAEIIDEENTLWSIIADPVDALLDVYRGTCEILPEESVAAEMALRQIAAALRQLIEHVEEHGYVCTPSEEDVAFVLCVGRDQNGDFYATTLYFGERRGGSYEGRLLQDPVLSYGASIPEAVKKLWRCLEEGVYRHQVRRDEVA